MLSTEQRLICLEGGCEHLTTKSKLYQLENQRCQLEIRMIRWLEGISIGMSILAVQSRFCLFKRV